METLLAKAPEQDDQTVDNTLKEFAALFSSQHALNIEFTNDARKELTHMAKASSLTVADFCRDHFRDLHFGLKLISGNTGQTSFKLGKSFAKNPDTALSQQVVASYKEKEVNE